MCPFFSSKGRHIIIDFYGLERAICVKPQIWERAFASIADLMKVKVITKHSHVFSAPVQPGLTAFFLLDASHLSVHTYADEGKAAVDMFSCTDFEDEVVVQQLLKVLEIGPSKIRFQTSIARFNQ